jgi:SAM-dependent methyltransferase
LAETASQAQGLEVVALIERVLMNFFSFKTAAERYTAGRPYFHPLVIERIRTFLALTKPVRRAVDVGCGTGLSAIALKEIAVDVFGIDASSEMLTRAARSERIQYMVADALRLPLSESEFDLMTLCSAFHWLEREKFLREAGRVLGPQGWLIVYDNYFSGRMEENAAFEQWYRESHVRNYPPPPRSQPVFTEEDSGNEGFHLAGFEQYQNKISFSMEELIAYLTSHSNVIAAVEAGQKNIDAVRLSLRENLEPLFGDSPAATFLFNGPIWYLQKQGMRAEG